MINNVYKAALKKRAGAKEQLAALADLNPRLAGAWVGELLAGGMEPVARSLIREIQGYEADRRRRTAQATNKAVIQAAKDLGVGGAAAAGTYGITGLIPGVKKDRFLRWLLSGTAGVTAAGLMHRYQNA